MGIGGGGKFNPFQPIELLRQPGPPPFRQTVGPMKQGLVYHVHSQTPTAPVRETNTEAPASPGPRHPDAASQSWAGSSQSWAGSCLPGLLPVPKVPCCMAGNSLCRRGEGIHCVTESGRGRGGGEQDSGKNKCPGSGDLSLCTSGPRPSKPSASPALAWEPLLSSAPGVRLLPPLRTPFPHVWEEAPSAGLAPGPSAHTGHPGGSAGALGCLGLSPSSTLYQLCDPGQVTSPASVSSLENEDSSSYFTGSSPPPHVK